MGTAQQVMEVLSDTPNMALLSRKHIDIDTFLVISAAFNPSPAVITEIINMGANPNSRLAFNKAPVYSVFEQNYSIDRNLIERRFDGKTALMIAATNNPNPFVINELIRSGANLKAIGERDDSTALHCAAQYNNPEVVIELIKAGADVNIARLRDGQSALMLAAKNNTNNNMIITLLNAGAKVNAVDKNRRTALMFAAEYNLNEIVVSTLIKAGAKVNLHSAGGTALMYAAASNPNSKVISQLIKAGAELNAEAGQYRTALHFAARNTTNPEIIKILVKAGANKGISPKLFKNIPLHERGNPLRSRFLRDVGFQTAQDLAQDNPDLDQDIINLLEP